MRVMFALGETHLKDGDGDPWADRLR